MAKWNLVQDIQIFPLNMGTHDKPQVVKLNVNLNSSVTDDVVEQLLKEYRYVFAWTYKDLRSIPLHLTQHRIELDTNIPTSHQA